jgi:hypothetical protein
MQFDGTTNLDRKSGFGLHQLRNRYGLYCLLVSLIVALFSGSLSRSQETRQQKVDLSWIGILLCESMRRRSARTEDLGIANTG